MAAEWHFRVYDILTRRYLADLPLYDVGWNDPLERGGTLEGVMTLTRMPDPVKEQLRRAIQFDTAWLFAYYGASIPWHGPIVAAPWSPVTSTLTVKCVQTSTWLDTVHMATTRTKKYAWKGVEQLQIARDIIGAISYPEWGRIPIGVDTTVSGIKRDLSFGPQAFQVASDAIDSMANRSGGFDWSILARDSATDGAPELYFQSWFPERRSPARPVHLLEQVDGPGTGGGNILDTLSWPEDAGARRTRVFTTGDGEAPSMMTAYDNHPGLVRNETVLREKVASYSGRGITKAATLADHAHTERRILAETVSTLSVPVTLDNPRFEDYQTGDRFRLVYRDEWKDVDFPAVRCVDRSVRCVQKDGKDSVTLELDLSDLRLPEQETVIS